MRIIIIIKKIQIAVRTINTYILTTESRIDVKLGINCSSEKVLHMGCTILLKASFSSPANSPDSFILLYNLERDYIFFIPTIKIDANASL